jgi:CheY-like chemotaxis protein
MLSHEEAEFRKGSTAGCDLLVVAAKREWGQAGALYPGSLFQTKRPALIIGERDVLAAVALWIHGGPREFIPAPWTVEDAIWRSAVVLSRLPASKTRKGKKNARRRVIIGDSDTSVSALLHAFLAQEGMECHVAENGVAALALAKAKEADAVIVDVSLPGLDGFQILAEIKRDPALHQAAVILLTARQTEADVLRGFGLGADDYLTKPFSPMEVAARLKRCFLRKP